jgi:ABC-2 type transport system permease protein
MKTPSDLLANEPLLAPNYQVIGESSWTSWSKTATLIKHMTWRSLAARYRGSALGFIWSLVNPIMLMVVYTFVFRYIFRISAPGVPFAAYLITGILAWNFLSLASIQASVALISGNALVNKCAFPKIVLPFSAVLASAVNYVAALPLLYIFILISGVKPTPNLLLLPFAVLLLAILAAGLGTLLSALMPFFRDLQHLIEVCFTMWFFLTPVVYDIGMVPERWQAWYGLNPTVGIIQLVHSVFLGQPIPGRNLLVAIAGSLGIFIVGLLVFNRLSIHSAEV